jgi:hypothetical protein
MLAIARQEKRAVEIDPFCGGGEKARGSDA